MIKIKIKGTYNAVIGEKTYPNSSCVFTLRNNVLKRKLEINEPKKRKSKVDVIILPVNLNKSSDKIRESVRKKFDENVKAELKFFINPKVKYKYK